MNNLDRARYLNFIQLIIKVEKESLNNAQHILKIDKLLMQIFKVHKIA
jgi:hypothetical protein